VTQPKNAEVVTAKPELDNAKGGLPLQNQLSGLLVSAQDLEEVHLALDCGVDWLDLKDPERGALGRPPLALVQSTARILAERPGIRWSIAGGELADWDPPGGLPYLEALGEQGAIKWALSRCAGTSDWPAKFAAAAHPLPSRKQAILVHYADHLQCHAPHWEESLAVAHSLGMRQLLVDTFIKNGQTLLDQYSREELTSMVDQARSMGLSMALAGSLRMDQLEQLGRHVGASWVGVRGSVCSGPGRSSRLSREKVKQAVAIVRGSATKKSRRESTHVIG
jgi:uncharacterized protein (UPF0264 family)